jgi:hypothetical protein
MGIEEAAEQPVAAAHPRAFLDDRRSDLAG